MQPQMKAESKAQLEYIKSLLSQHKVGLSTTNPAPVRSSQAPLMQATNNILQCIIDSHSSHISYDSSSSTFPKEAN
ncbi:hypothetical protein FRX31_026098 [Thalictrum thalictroides]|uniref:Uncharacterized protein n=1 Tax=Thalictrum thalictroides TaxID=46969 RepID=A0A7J6VHS2_THATH|nr:hypothetical protein FRX31_026098 [Thalictrum thalictroides]